MSNKPIGLHGDWFMFSCGLYFGVASLVIVCEQSKWYMISLSVCIKTGLFLCVVLLVS